MADLNETAKITKCPPGTAKGSTLHQWQFGWNDRLGPAEIGTARRLAEGDLKPCETLVFEVVVNHPSDMPQRDLEKLLFTQIGATRSQVYSAAQRLAKHGKLGRKKVGRQWHYAKPGFSWRSAQKAANMGSSHIQPKTPLRIAP